MGEMTQLNLRLRESRRERWDNYLEESGKANTMSELVRTSVEAKISDDEGTSGGHSPAIGQDIQDLKDEISELRSDVTWLRKQELEEVDISDLAQEVYNNLEVLPEPTDPLQIPEDQDATEYRRKRAAEMAILPKNPEDDPSPQTIEDLAERHDTKRTRIEDAIEHLQDQFLPVVKVELEGYEDELGNEVHYFREG